MAINGAFRGSGNTMISMALSIISLWVLRFPIAFFLSEYTGLGSVGIYISFPAANIIAAVITMIWFARGTWKQKKLTHEIRLTDETTKETIIEEGMNN
jgi:Na+-driven multidrug efflux pump